MSRGGRSVRRRHVATVLAGVTLAAAGTIGGAVQVMNLAASDTTPPTPERTEETSAAAPLTTAAVPVVAADPTVTVRRQRVGGPSDFPGSLGSTPVAVVAAYQRAATIMSSASTCGIRWTTLAAIGRVESNHNRGPALLAPLDGKGGRGELPDTDLGKVDGNPTWDAPVGPMALLPSTWRAVAVDADSDGRRNPHDIDDAALAAAVLLCAKGDLTKPAALRSALTSYHRAPGFVPTVLALATRYERQAAQVPPPPTVIGPLPVLPDLCRCAARPVLGASATPSFVTPPGGRPTLVPPAASATAGGTSPHPSPSGTTSGTPGASPTTTPSGTPTPTDTASPSASPTDATSATATPSGTPAPTAAENP
ncbi:hypothetical protein [Nocardioides sp. LML1-1-1.1]|uniref:hypothetical protein n=1 Tax=Nocardioides sp. LML1-1-1.1 TaxID=3135248 RepID=UPI00342C1E9C